MAQELLQKIIPNASFATALRAVADGYDYGQLLNQISQLAPSGLFIVDADKRILFWNNSAERISGLRAENVVGKKCTEALGCRPVDGYCPLDLPYVQETVVDQAATFNIACDTTTVLKNISVVEDDNGRRVGAIEYFIDVNRQSIAESALEAAAQLIRTTRQAKDEFISNINHEIRTPINGIIGMLDLLTNNTNNDFQREHLSIASGAAGSLLKIVDHLLDFSVIEKGHPGFSNEVFNLNVLINSLSDCYRDQLKSKSIDMKIDVDRQVPTLLSGNSNRLLQILKNLINNAIKATDEGMIELSVNRSPKTDLLKISNPYKISLQFLVEDTGCGISEDKMPHIFREFSQADGSHTRVMGGLGLGLHLTWRLIKMQGGDLNISSKVGKGTRLQFDLPFLIVEETEDVSEVKTSSELSTVNWMEELKTIEFWIDRDDEHLEEKLGRLQRLSRDQGKDLLTDHLFRIQLAVRKNDKTGSMKIIQKIRHIMGDPTT